MANLMKLCKNCIKWTDENTCKCPICGNRLIEAKLSNIYWNKISTEEKDKYTKEYLNSNDYMPEESNENLSDGIIFRLKGYNGQLYIYKDKVIIERKGIMGMLTNGLAGSKTIPISNIKNIQLRKAGPLFSGYIQFGILGGIEKQNGLTGAVNDENSIVFLEDCNEKAQKIKEYIENIITSKNNQYNTDSNSFSSADEILKLKQLLDMGILTQEEFNAKKKQLLGI